MSICMKNFYFPMKLFKSGFVANVNKREEPGFGMLHHIYLTHGVVLTLVDYLDPLVSFLHLYLCNPEIQKYTVIKVVQVSCCICDGLPSFSFKHRPYLVPSLQKSKFPLLI